MVDQVMSPKLQVKIQQARHLLNLASNTLNENEAAASAAAAAKIIDEWRISEEMLADKQIANPDPMTAIQVREGGKRSKWREDLLDAFTTHYGCAWYLSSYRVGGNRSPGAPGSKGKSYYKVVGRESDCQIVDYFFNYLEKEALRISAHYSKGRGITFGHSWLAGFAQGINDQLVMQRQEMRAQAGLAESTAIVKLDKRGEESHSFMYDKCGVRKGGASSIYGGQNAMAQMMGREVGRKTTLREGMGTGTSVPKLGR